jgi:putative hemolysin
LLAGLVILSGFFSGAEISFFSLSKLKVKYMLKKGIKGAEIVDKLKNNPQKLLVTILIGNNLVNVLASVLATSIAIKVFNNYAVGITTGAMTLILLIFGEITPKSFAVRYNEKIALFSSRPLLFFQYLFYPFVLFFSIILKRVVDGEKKPLITEEEIKAYVSIGEDVGEVKETEEEIIHRIFRFSDMKAKDVMTPRKKIIFVDKDDRIKDIIKIFSLKKHPKIIACDKNIDNIKGFVNIYDAQKNVKRNIRVSKITKPISFISSEKTLDSLLKFFQAKKQSIAVVIDSYGTNIGIVTVEDVIEEIVGEIMDETDKVSPLIKKAGKGRFIVDGKADIAEINKELNLNLPYKKGVDTISSLVEQKISDSLKKGRSVNIGKWNIKIKSMDSNVISSLLIEKLRKAKTKKSSSRKDMRKK